MVELERSAMARKVERASDRIADRWSPAREALIGRQLERRVRRRAIVRRAGAALALLLLVGTGTILVRRAEDPAAPVARGIVLTDGSRVEALVASARVEERAGGVERRVVLRGGRARFAVRPDASRPFVVELEGELEVRVLGTVFVVDPGAALVEVLVEEGHVLVQRRGTTLADLRAGGRASVPITAQPDAVAEPVPHAPAVPDGVADTDAVAGTVPDPATKRAAPRPRQQAPDWRALAEGSDYPAAFEALRGRKLAGVEELLLAADVARLSGHAADALGWLGELEARHAADPRAPLAVFTRGRILLEELGRPREAAASFVRAAELDPDGPLVADALAREVEAWWRAGDKAAARARAEDYVRRFPKGQRIRAVRLYGDLP